MQVEVARATRWSLSSTTSHSTSPTVPPGLHDPPNGDERAGPDRLQEVDLELERGEGLALLEGQAVGHAHRGIGDVAEDTAVQGSHRVGVARLGRELDDGAAGLDGGQGESDQSRDGRRGDLPSV